MSLFRQSYHPLLLIIGIRKACNTPRTPSGEAALIQLPSVSLPVWAVHLLRTRSNCSPMPARLIPISTCHRSNNSSSSKWDRVGTHMRCMVTPPVGSPSFNNNPMLRTWSSSARQSSLKTMKMTNRVHSHASVKSNLKLNSSSYSSNRSLNSNSSKSRQRCRWHQAYPLHSSNSKCLTQDMMVASAMVTLEIPPSHR